MIVSGIIAEYNPLHNGHLYHINATRQLTGADYIVCVMSSNFVQRGEAAIVNKWFRTQMALAAGIDIVIELPSLYATQNAEQFAFNAVKLLNSTGIIDYLCFGSESGDLSSLITTANLLHDEPLKLKSVIKEKLSQGMSYPSAIAQALSYINSDFSLTPNNILALEYIKALKKLNSQIKPVTVKRLYSSYNSTALQGEISSATSIRKTILERSLAYEGIQRAIPEFSKSILSNAFQRGYGPISMDAISLVILHELRKMPLTQLRNISDISEGLEYRIKEAAKEAGTFEMLIKLAKTKRYTWARIQRAIIHAMLGITDEMIHNLHIEGGPQYIRILGFSESGRKLLKHIDAKCSLPILSKAADYKNVLPAIGRTLFETEIYATDLYSLAYPNAELRRAGNEFTQDLYHI